MDERETGNRERGLHGGMSNSLMSAAEYCNEPAFQVPPTPYGGGAIGGVRRRGCDTGIQIAGEGSLSIPLMQQTQRPSGANEPAVAGDVHRAVRSRPQSRCFAVGARELTEIFTLLSY